MTGSEFSSGHFLQFGAKCPSFWGPQFNWDNFSHKVFQNLQFSIPKMNSSLSVGEVVRGLQGSQDQAILQTEVRVLRSRSSRGARRLPGWKRTRRPSARRGGQRRFRASWRSGPVSGSRVRTRRWRPHLWPCPPGSGGGPGAQAGRRGARRVSGARR